MPPWSGSTVSRTHHLPSVNYVGENTARLGGSAIGGRTTRQWLSQVDQCPPGHREGVCLDLDEVFSAGVTMGWSAPVQTARHRKGERGVWSAGDRLQPDAPRQSAPSRGSGGGMSSALPRGVDFTRAQGQRDLGALHDRMRQRSAICKGLQLLNLFFAENQRRQRKSSATETSGKLNSC